VHRIKNAKSVIDIFDGVLPFHNVVYYKSVFDTDRYTYTRTGMRGRIKFKVKVFGMSTKMEFM
jgi:hypothetical protein